MKLKADTKLSEIEIPMLLMFVEEAFNVPVFQSGQREPTALNWTIKELAKEANRSPEQSIEMLNHLIKEYQDLEVSAEDLKSKYQGYYLLDIRLRWEWDICKLEGSKFIEDIDFNDEFDQIKKDGCIVICHHGVRSLSGALYLRSLGVKAYSLKGGLDYWAKNIDPSMKQY